MTGASLRKRWDTSERRELLPGVLRWLLLTAPRSARPTGFRLASSQLEKVADLYQQVVAAGGDHARRPSIYVHQALAEEGSDITLNTVRGQIHRARVKGLIPPTASD